MTRRDFGAASVQCKVLGAQPKDDKPGGDKGGNKKKGAKWATT